MHLIPPTTNVFYDGHSAYPLEKLNEGSYYIEFLSRLGAASRTRYPDVDFFLFSAHTPRILPESAARTGRRKVLFMISGESGYIPTHLQADYDLIFKAYLPREIPATPGGIYALPLGHVNGFPVRTPAPWAERVNSVFFSGNLNVHRVGIYRAFTGANDMPALVVKALVRLKQARRLLKRWNTQGLQIPGAKIEFTSGFRAGLPIAEYADQIYQSRVVLCPKGFLSTETFRHFEAAAAGAIVISEPLPDLPIYKGSPFIEVNNWTEGRDVLNRLLGSTRDELAELGMATRKWYDDKLSMESTIARIIDLMDVTFR